ncbi:MAG: helix-turn-helix transcriptional regulator [Cypionkella sp.]|uniref:helix-turn-helix domain-containing protein n=1 Tax=Cypionkella sp. TaxID=2811411 RepID=UPI0027316F3C|nr:helix-turn-helix transcriptional regulator [Cypionkella sp.]MDP2047604.1 helix-turn-helix transcriptional regulator [Cypionkella sp.]
MADNPDQIDVHVGAAMRTLRLNAGFSQQAIGDAMGVRFQQVQKYETGKNRISASRLKRAADVLGASINDFFRGLEDEPGESDITAILADAGALETARKIHAMPDLARQGLISIVATMAAHAA